MTLLDILNSASMAEEGQVMVMMQSLFTMVLSMSLNGSRFSTRTPSPLMAVLPYWMTG